MFHVELRQFPHVARAFNLSRQELDDRFVGPWVSGGMIEHDERRWAPERVRLKILEGPLLAPEDLGMGRGWATATKVSQEVTEAVLAQARRGAGARTELVALKESVSELAAVGMGFADVVALAAAAQPGWRASQQLELAEQAVWELLHQGRLSLSCDGDPVGQEDWQAVVLSWETWSDASPARLSLRAAD